MTEQAHPAWWRRADVVVPLIGVLLLAVTTDWIGWDQAVREELATDVAQYEAIASAAPDATSRPLVSQHATRFPIHYATGIVADWTGVSLRTLYRVLMALCLVAVAFLLHRALRRGGLYGLPLALCLASVLGIAYLFRYFAIAPGMLQDSAFVVSILVVTLGVLERRIGVVTAGMVLAVLTRSEAALLIVPVVGFWFMREAAVAGRSRRDGLVGLALVVLTPVVAYCAVRWVSTIYPNRFPYPPLSNATIIDDLGALSSRGDELLAHAGRVLLGVALPGALLAAVACGRSRFARPIPLEVWTVLGIAFAVALQPLALSIEVAGHNEARLSALGAAPLAVAAGLLMRESADTVSRALTRWDWAVLFLLFAAASLHHRYATVGPSTATGFAILELLCAAAIAALIAYRVTRPAPR